jgi:hypothetical protein
MQGVAFFLDKFELATQGLEQSDTKLSASSQFISLVKDCLRRSFEQQHQRLMAAMYRCVDLY